MSNSAIEISNLLFRYAEYIDSGALEQAAVLFRHAKVKVPFSNEPIDAEGLLSTWRRMIRIYPCGTPRTKHLVTNVILEIDETSGTAKSRSYYTVYQSTDNFPLQLIAAGRYHDEFERVDAVWRFSYRDYSMLDMVGNTSAHLTQSLDSSG